MRAGIEIGGTFTDVVLLKDDGSIATHKVPSTPEDPSIGAMDGLLGLLDREAIALAAVDELFHGSTIATNTLLERKGARAALIATSGFEDVLLIGRQDKTRVYDMFYRKPVPLIPRDRIFGIAERLDGRGEVVLALDAAEIDRVIDDVLAVEGLESLAVTLLHAYRNPAHEALLKQRWLQRAPAIPISISSEIAPEFREYERTSTTAIASYVKPRVAEYLGRMERNLARRGFHGNLLIMQSNGGVVPAPAASANPAKMFLSGPAAGVTGASFVGRRLGMRNLLTIDIGGTSCDACILMDGAAQNTQRGFAEYKIDGLPISLMMVDITTLGAGGGSVAWVDDGGMLQVGPQSAGALPGPACYGRGGSDFTVSDALLLLGMIDASSFIGGRMKLDAGASERAARPLCARLGLGALDLAESVRRITIANIARALRLVTVQRGFDPREFALFAYGGAGPAFAAAIADEMDIGTVVVPIAPGIFSAFGLSVADTKLDFVRSMPGTHVSRADPAGVIAAFESMADQARTQFREFGMGIDGLAFAHAIDARYVGQGYELPVPVEVSALRRHGLKPVADGFHAAHLQRYALQFLDQDVEIIGCRTVARLGSAAIPIEAPSIQADAGAVRHATIRFGARDLSTAFVQREQLRSGVRLDGPALIGETSSATIVPPGWHAVATATGELMITRDRSAAA